MVNRVTFVGFRGAIAPIAPPWIRPYGTDWLIPSYSVRTTRSRSYGMRAFLFCLNVWPLCYVTYWQFCHNAWWCWRSTPDERALCCCSFAVCECIRRKREVQETVNKDFNFYQAIFAPLPKWRPWLVPCLPYPRYATANIRMMSLRFERLKPGLLPALPKLA